MTNVENYAASVTPMVRHALKKKLGVFAWLGVLAFVVRWLPTIIQLVTEIMAAQGLTTGQLVPQTYSPEVLDALDAEKKGRLDP